MATLQVPTFGCILPLQIPCLERLVLVREITRKGRERCRFRGRSVGRHAYPAWAFNAPVQRQPPSQRSSSNFEEGVYACLRYQMCLVWRRRVPAIDTSPSVAYASSRSNYLNAYLCLNLGPKAWTPLTRDRTTCTTLPRLYPYSTVGLFSDIPTTYLPIAYTIPR